MMRSWAPRRIRTATPTPTGRPTPRLAGDGGVGARRVPADVAFSERRPSTLLPWRLDHLLTTFLTLTAGAALIVGGWWGTSSTSSVSRQASWLSMGVLGMVVAAVGAGL